MTWVTAPLASALLVVAKANLAYPGNFSVTPLAQQEVDMIHTHHYYEASNTHSFLVAVTFIVRPLLLRAALCFFLILWPFPYAIEACSQP